MDPYDLFMKATAPKGITAETKHSVTVGNVTFSIGAGARVTTYVHRGNITDVVPPGPTLDEIDEAIDSLRCAQQKQRTGKCD